jgi:3-dehydroquinate synthase
MTPGPVDGTVRVGASAGSYEVRVGSGCLASLPDLLQSAVGAHRYALISDDDVAALHGDAVIARCRDAGLDAELFSFPAGERSKTRKSWSILTDRMLAGGFGRDSCVVALGGGVTGDLSGFVAATYLRGVPLVQLPTSYLAMIDASVGGKTGVDVAAGKNLVGAFHAPRFVLADTDLLTTLPTSERVQGLVEAFKHGATMDSSYFDWLSEHAARLIAVEGDVATEAVLRSVRLKAAVVTEDEREAGPREVLNFGHTLGHALEAASDFQVGHGTAVAAGMVLEAELGERLGVTRAGTRERIALGLAALGVGLDVVAEIDIDVALGFLGTDKKSRRGRPRFVLLEELGRVHREGGWSREAPETMVSEVMAEVAGSV